MGYIGNKPTAVPLTSADIEDGVISAADLGANSVDSSELVDGSIDTSHIGALQVTTAKLAADAVDGTKLADDAVNSEHYTDGSIDNAHIADDQIDSEHYADGSIDTAHIGATQVTGAKLNTDVISAQTELAVAPADTDEFLVSDGGVLKRIDYSLMKGGTAWDFLYTDSQSSNGNGTVDYTEASLFTSTYDTYRIYIADWIPQNDGIDLSVRLKIGGSTRTGNYAFHKTRVKSDSNSYSAAYDNDTGDGVRIIDTAGNASEEVSFGWFEYHNPSVSNGEHHHITTWHTGMDSSHLQTSGMGGGTCRDSTGTLTGFTLRASAGGIGTYNLYAYGLKS